MPATSAHIGFITQEFRTVKSGPDSGVVTKYGDAARKTEEAIPTYFEAEADAQAMSDARLTLLKADRRRFSSTISGEPTGLALNYIGATPAATLIDDERQANMAGLISDISIDFSREETKLEVWG